MIRLVKHVLLPQINVMQQVMVFTHVKMDRSFVMDQNQFVPHVQENQIMTKLVLPVPLLMMNVVKQTQVVMYVKMVASFAML